MKDVDTRISPTFHPAVFGESDDPILKEAASHFDSAYKALKRIHDAREQTASSPLLTKAAATLKVADLADKSERTVLTSLDSSRSILEGAIRNLHENLNKPFSDNSRPMNSEIRNYFKSLSAKERSSALRDAIKKQDETTLRAVLSAPAYLSGLNPEEQNVYMHETNKAREPENFARLQTLQTALDRVNNIGLFTVHEQIEKGIGTSRREVDKLREKQARLEKAFK